MIRDPMSPEIYKELFELRALVDELIEEGMVHRWSVSEVIGRILPKVAERLGATGAFVENVFWARPGDYRKATQRIYRSKALPSHIDLPVVARRKP